MFRAIYRFPSVTASAVAAGSMETTSQLKIEASNDSSGDIAKVRDELDSAGLGQDVFVVCQTQAEAERLGVLSKTRLAETGNLHFPIGTLHAGYRLVTERIVLVSGGELFHRTDITRPTRRRLGRVIDSFLELREGDHVVHLAHGIGKYRGLKLLSKGTLKNTWKLSFPAPRRSTCRQAISSWSKSTSAEARVGRHWRMLAVRPGSIKRRRLSARCSTWPSRCFSFRRLASRGPGIAFPEDTQWQREFDAAFPYRETADQLVAIEAIKSDMQHPRHGPPALWRRRVRQN